MAALPLRGAAALAVIRNPFAGAYVKEIAGFMDETSSPWAWKWRANWWPRWAVIPKSLRDTAREPSSARRANSSAPCGRSRRLRHA